ncbi:MAG: MFS transporter [Acidobacteria bacterium]|nr:MAG: MFS transporter [Acidobacteriota bacterium]
MNATTAAGRQRLPGTLVIVLALLGLSVFINYIDRGNLSIAAPMLKDELGISASRLGLLLSAFFWTYACFQLISGWLVDHLDVSWVMAAGFFVWSSATAVTGLAHGFLALFLLRLVLGMGESVAYPSYSKILARYFPESHRGIANAVTSGLALGPGIGMFMGGMLMARYGWRAFFIGLGLASLVWLAPWIKWMPRRPVAQAGSSAESPHILKILRQRSMWGTSAGLFCGNYLNYFFITWLPFYLVRERHLSLQAMAKIGGMAYLLTALSATSSGWLSDRWIAAGGSPTRVRKTFTSLGMVAGSIFLVICVSAGPAVSLVTLMLVGISFGMCASNLWAITQTLAGPHAAGRWTGVQNFIGNLSGIVAPAVTGLVLDRTGKFFWAFVITAAVAVLGAMSWIFLVGPVEQVDWTSPCEVPRADTAAEIASAAAK